MHKIVISLFFVILLFLPSTANAAAPGFTSQSVATAVFSDTSSLTLSFPNNNPMGCGNGSNLRLPMNYQNYATIASMIITGFAGGKTMQFYVSACDSDGSGLITAVSVQK